MADLSEYLGHILCEVTRARVMADHEAVRIAKEYVADASGYLRHFPVPRMRLPDLEITVPVVVAEIPEGYVETTSADPEFLGKLLATEIVPLLDKQGIKINTAELTKMIRDDPMLSKGRISADLADTLTAKIQRSAGFPKEGGPGEPEPKSPAERFQVIASTIREEIEKNLASLPRKPAGIRIDGKTAAIKEVGSTAMVVNVKMVIKEESMEMLLDNPAEGKGAPTISRLVPE